MNIYVIIDNGTRELRAFFNLEMAQRELALLNANEPQQFAPRYEIRMVAVR